MNNNDSFKQKIQQQKTLKIKILLQGGTFGHW